jgi:hypothetical protein
MGRTPGAKNKPKVTVEGDTAPPKEKKAKPVRIDYERQAALEEESDMLHIPPEIIPDGMRYNWKTISILGQQQTRRFGRFQATGWEPVPASRHPGLFTPKGYEGEIEYDGLVLMEKPEELCRQTEAREYRKARQQVQAKEQQLRGGDVGTTLDSRHKSALQSNKINKSYEKIDIPE